ncbi:monovalent cation/H+ antiporter subunit D family protein [Parvularcula sp. ZS-1/3]|uniref:Monovalent cation/H+ antiporter subunit D family protein n=1 Tax=Parvularcula mediterranea TaxID=2732508 RepID=A0A7Y3RM38_9PROT|nr:monovalent cation/H+ antiporter subunit D family protein [Parvularcula mediterranea]NNU16618.1 monovalent cation/H+ antiporter subunit D family protein [Parvularcula mediterranea]
MILDDLPVLPVIIPLFAAPICLLLPNTRLAGSFATLIAWVSFAFAAMLLATVAEVGPIEYGLGGWANPLGIVYRVDLAGAIVMTLVSLLASVVFPYAIESARDEIVPSQTSAFFAMFLICFSGLMGVVATGDAFNVFVFLEISSLSTYTLVALGAKRDRRALTAAFTYLVLGTIGATFFVIGLGLLYQVTGTLNMTDLHDRLQGADNKVIRAGYAFIFTGLGLKLAMFPMHRWLPAAYTYAPSAVTAFLASTSTKVAIYAMLRFLFTIFGFSFGFADIAFGFFLVLGLVGMFYASTVAIFREDVKMILAYSSVAQIGYMLLGISFATVDGVGAALVHVFQHAVMKTTLFMAVGAVFFALGSHRLSAYKGLGKTMPVTTGVFLIGGLSLVGVPLTGGFISKWVLVQAAFGSVQAIPSLLIVLMIVASSLLAVAYVGRIAWTMLLEEPTSRTPRKVPLAMMAPMLLMAAVTIYFGIDAEGLVNICRAAAESLLDTGLGYGGAM